MHILRNLQTKVGKAAAKGWFGEKLGELWELQGEPNRARFFSRLAAIGRKSRATYEFFMALENSAKQTSLIGNRWAVSWMVTVGNLSFKLRTSNHVEVVFRSLAATGMRRAVTIVEAADGLFRYGDYRARVLVAQVNTWEADGLTLVPSARVELNQSIADGHCYAASWNDFSRGSVRLSFGTSFMDIDATKPLHCAYCGSVSAMPCAHRVAAVQFLVGQHKLAAAATGTTEYVATATAVKLADNVNNLQRECHPAHLVASSTGIRQMEALGVFPMLDDVVGGGDVILCPHNPRKRGRASMHARLEGRADRRHSTCSRCHDLGHNKATCTAELPDDTDVGHMDPDLASFSTAAMQALSAGDDGEALGEERALTEEAHADAWPIASGVLQATAGAESLFEGETAQADDDDDAMHPAPARVSRQCSRCRQFGHNKRSCKLHLPVV